ncbi:DUF2381 family protein [Stigmatella hybrida]|nr:DUF2381 family protein [Stigmatella hybrida]
MSIGKHAGNFVNVFQARSYRSKAEPLSPGATDMRVVIEADAPEAESRGSFTLKVWDAEGTRSVIVTGVTYP